MALSENEIIAVVSVTGTLLGVIIGWALSHLSEYLKSKKDRENKLKAITLEVADIEDILKFSINSNLKRAMKCREQNKPLATSLPAKQNLIAYEEYFKSVLSSLSTDYRRNLSAFANEVRNYNSAVSEIESAVRHGEFGFNLAIRFHMAAIISGKIICMARWLESEQKNTRFNFKSQEFREFDNLLDDSWSVITKSKTN